MEIILTKIARNIIRAFGFFVAMFGLRQKGFSFLIFIGIGLMVAAFFITSRIDYLEIKKIDWTKPATVEPNAKRDFIIVQVASILLFVLIAALILIATGDIKINS